MEDMELIDYIPFGPSHITCLQLQQLTGLSRRQIQAGIRNYRDNDVPVCGSCGINPGYWIAQSQEEWNQYVDTIEYMEKDCSYRVQKYRDISVDEYLQQFITKPEDTVSPDDLDPIESGGPAD